MGSCLMATLLGVDSDDPPQDPVSSSVNPDGWGIVCQGGNTLAANQGATHNRDVFSQSVEAGSLKSR